MKKFKVTLEGKEFLVEVEEVIAGGTAAQQTQPQVALKPANPSPTKTATAASQLTAKSVPPEKPAPGPSAEGDYAVKAPMPGSVLDVKVTVGDRAAEGDVLLVLEAMKMENELTAPQAGTVKEVLVKKGDTVNSGDPLIILS